MGSPMLCASPRLVSSTVRATYSCWHNTGSHCAARLRGTMENYFLPLPTTPPGSLEPGSPVTGFRVLGKLLRGHILQEELLGKPSLKREM